MKKTILVLGLLAVTAITAGAQNREQMIGCWTMPTYHGEESLSLLRNGRFSFNDWNDRRNDYDHLDGKWSFERGRVTLWYTDRSKQSFTVRRDRRGRWLLSKAGGFELRKADPSDCHM